jgi:hypothetical protein
MIDLFAPLLGVILVEKWGGEGKSGERAQFRPTINLVATFFHSLSLQRTRPARTESLITTLPGRPVRGR